MTASTVSCRSLFMICSSFFLESLVSFFQITLCFFGAVLDGLLLSDADDEILSLKTLSVGKLARRRMQESTVPSENEFAFSRCCPEKA